MASLVSAQLLFLESENPEKEISLYINSPGGVVSDGLAIYDTMQFIQSPVSTLCFGQAASMGSFLLAAGEKDKRFALPNSRIMVHQPSAGFQGQATDIEIHAKEVLAQKSNLNKRKKLTSAHELHELAKIADETIQDRLFLESAVLYEKEGEYFECSEVLRKINSALLSDANYLIYGLLKAEMLNRSHNF
mgnify:CR=1 FL=1